MNANSGAAIYEAGSPPSPQPEPTPGPDPGPEPEPAPEPTPGPNPDGRTPEPTPDELPPGPPGPPKEKSGEGEPYNRVLIDLVIGGALLFVLLIITSICYCLKKRQQDQETRSIVYSQLNTKQLN